MYLRQTTNNELIKYINSLKNKCSPGPDQISTKIIKDIHEYILEPLKHIINLIFKTGIVPTHFKTTIITPIHKAGNKNLISNYRPISLINNFAKIFEKCLKDRITDYFYKNNILSNNQFGFMKELSTDDAIYELVKDITDHLNNNEKCLAVFLDLAKAFDTVPHDKLLNVLDHYGVRGNVLDVFQNYLTNRIQHVRIRDTISEGIQIKIGVPQGTVLGPILFIIYINTLTKLNVNGRIISYADDTVLIYKGKSWEEVKRLAKLGIVKVKNWLDSFRLSLNVKKTNYIAFSITNANRPDFNEIKIDNLNDAIKSTSHTKYLGVIIDENLKWENHTTYVTNKIRCLIYKFYILKEFIAQELLLILYKSLVETLIRYGIIAWGGLYNNALRKLNVIQNYILRIIYKKNRLYSTELLYTEDINNIRTLYILKVCSYVQKNIKLRHYITHEYGTRSRIQQHLKIPNSNRSINLRSTNYLAPKFYNLIPTEIKQIINMKSFCHQCKKYITRRYSDFIKFL